MTTRLPPQCLTCARWDGAGTKSCEAYPTQIPDEIWDGNVDHRDPYKGDHGLQWQSAGQPFPAWVLVRKGD